MKTIGGYFGLECGDTPLYYKNGLYLNSCRNALRYLIRSLGINKIYIPVFTCEVVEHAIISEKCEIVKYNIGKDLFPLQKIPHDAFVIYNNYFGINGRKVSEMVSNFPNLIVDNAQAFYAKPYGRANVYSLRKFFGVPDGGILIGKNIPTLFTNQGFSYDVISHLTERIDLGAEQAYSSFIRDEGIIDKYPVMKMSKLTRALLGNINYKKIKQKRLENFNFLMYELPSQFPFSMAPDDVPLVFPYYVKNGEALRSKLIKDKVFCARYWPNVMIDKNANSFEFDLAENIISIPIDQRYGIEEMKYIVNLIT